MSSCCSVHPSVGLSTTSFQKLLPHPCQTTDSSSLISTNLYLDTLTHIYHTPDLHYLAFWINKSHDKLSYQYQTVKLRAKRPWNEEWRMFLDAEHLYTYPCLSVCLSFPNFWFRRLFDNVWFRRLFECPMHNHAIQLQKRRRLMMKYLHNKHGCTTDSG